ncbi:hypothetical protein AMECASPLE_036226 [Ameca splendens]|uniref:Uncharacterized protein n=1 Tax=Ameca splendens TaxID=208324 RepID=A0ABV1AEV0_9TELE
MQAPNPNARLTLNTVQFRCSCSAGAARNPNHCVHSHQPQCSAVAVTEAVRLNEMFPQEGSVAGRRSGFCVKLMNFTSQIGSQTGERSGEFNNNIYPPTYTNLTSVNKTTKNRKTSEQGTI